MSWEQWSNVSGGVADPRTSVTAVPVGDGNIALFVVGVGGGVFTTTGNTARGWAPWSTVSEGRAGPGCNITAVPIGNGRFALFLADPGGEVFTASGSAAGGWSQWSSVSEGQAGPGVSVSAVPIRNGQFSLFVADPGGGVFTASGSATRGWSQWSSVSEGHAGPGVSVTAVPIGDGRIALFLADPGGGVFTASGSAARGWSPWSNVSEGHAGPGVSITAVPIAGSRVALFLADPAGGVFTASGSAAGGWSPWSSVAEGIAGPGTRVTAVPAADGRFAVFVADPAGGVFSTLGNAVRGWVQWVSVSEGHAGPGTFVGAVPIGGNRFAVFVADPGGGIFATSGDHLSADFNHAIKHVFVLMLENRSFGHLLGFSGITGTDAETGIPTRIEGLTGSETNHLSDGTEVTVRTGATDVIRPDPGHNFLAVLEQLCGPSAGYPEGGPYPNIDNSGFASNYEKKVGAQGAGEIMKCFGSADLPVLNALAREFAVCDHWFCSMPGPTEPNRYFMYAGSCGAFDGSPTEAEIAEAVGKPGGGFRFRNGATLFKFLDTARVKWRMYAGDLFPVPAELDGVSVVTDREDFEDFAKDLRDPSFDAGFVLIEPNYNVVTLVSLSPAATRSTRAAASRQASG